MELLGKIGIGFGMFFVWIFANGFWEISIAPEYYNYCQSIDWAQLENKNEFRPDEMLALWILEGISCN